MLSQVQRAELVRLLAELPAEQVRDAAAHLGFEYQAEKPTPREPNIGVPTTIQPRAREPRRPPEKSARPVLHRYARIPFLSVRRVEVTPLEDDPFVPEDLPWTVADLVHDPVVEPPTAEPLSPWSRLGPLLLGPLHTRRRSQEVDAERFVERWSRSAVIEEIPRLERRGWCQRLILILDRSQRLMPFWQDQDDVERNLCAQLGATALHVIVLEDGPLGPVKVQGAFHPRFAPSALPEGPILVLSDLGQYANELTRVPWRHLGHRLRSAGRTMFALCPVPRSRLDPGLARTWQVLLWEREDLFLARGAGEDLVGVSGLLMLLSACVRIEPGLLREVRRLLPRNCAGAATEADLWSHRALEGASTGAGRVEPGEAETWRERLRAVDSKLRRQVVDALKRWHAEVHAPEIWVEEALRPALWEVLTEAEREEVRAWVRRLRVTLESGAVSEGLKLCLPAHARRLFHRTPSRLAEDRELRRDLSRVVYLADQEKHGTPGWFDPAQRRPGRAPAKSLLVLSARGRRVFVSPASEQDLPGRYLASFTAREPRVYCAPSGRPGRPQALGSAASLFFDLDTSTSHVLWTDETRIDLEFVTKPDWASGIHQDAKGLWATVRGDDEELKLERRLGQGVAMDLGEASGPTATKTYHAPLWVAKDVPEWATSVQVDDYGVVAELAVPSRSARQANVAWKMRWVPPGSFLMGSPPMEEEREDWEWPPHEVSLTRGVWLAETPCTQELWQAVMGENPSRFQSPTRPVEQVSWEDCQRFLDRLNAATAGAFRLPSEAEWEYACRAGTTTSTYAGEMKILGANHGPILDEIAWYGGNSGLDFELAEGESTAGWPEKQHEHARAGTHPVGRKRPNPWGFYEMLGNVYEWCDDVFQDGFDRGPVTDPSVKEGSERVFRGGSWHSRARGVRAAHRYGNDPGHRYDYLGFRLARGQGLSSAEPGSSTASEGAGDAGRGTSRRAKPKRARRRR